MPKKKIIKKKNHIVSELSTLLLMGYTPNILHGQSIKVLLYGVTVQTELYDKNSKGTWSPHGNCRHQKFLKK